jgi:hypothetical protein
MSGLSRHDRVKWTLLEHAGANNELGILHGVIRLDFADAPPREIDEDVYRAMLELYDEGLVAMFRAGQPEGYDLKLDEVQLLSREEVIKELDDLIARVEPGEFVWVRETAKGEEVFRRLPRETLEVVRSGTRDQRRDAQAARQERPVQ